MSTRAQIDHTAENGQNDNNDSPDQNIFRTYFDSTRAAVLAALGRLATENHTTESPNSLSLWPYWNLVLHRISMKDETEAPERAISSRRGLAIGSVSGGPSDIFHQGSNVTATARIRTALEARSAVTFWPSACFINLNTF